MPTLDSAEQLVHERFDPHSPETRFPNPHPTIAELLAQTSAYRFCLPEPSFEDKNDALEEQTKKNCVPEMKQDDFNVRRYIRGQGRCLRSESLRHRSRSPLYLHVSISH